MMRAKQCGVALGNRVSHLNEVLLQLEFIKGVMIESTTRCLISFYTITLKYRYFHLPKIYFLMYILETLKMDGSQISLQF